MDNERQNREAICSLGDLVEELFDEVNDLPLSDPAKASLVTIMFGDIMRREGRTVSFHARYPLTVHLAAA